MWNERYSEPGFAYGTEPNDFLRANVDKLPTGNCLCLAEGEGRNAVWLAQQGLQVTAVDASEVGLKKAQELARERGVSIDTVHADLEQFDLGLNQWDAIISIFCHLPPDLRQLIHQRCVAGLRSGGIMLLEAYTPAQLEFKTGGPPAVEMMMDSEQLKAELHGLHMVHLQETTRDIHEGKYHQGQGAVVQMIASKP